MAIRLRTRLFLTVAIVLAVSIAASSLLSRRATLVEVQETVSHQAVPIVVRVVPVRALVEARMREAPSQDFNPVLAEGERMLGRPMVLVDPQFRLIAGSTPDLASARVRRGSPDGELVLETHAGVAQTTIAVRGAPPYGIRDGRGQPVAWLFVLPEAADRSAPERGHVLPLWVLTTGSIAAIALLLTFTLSRRILRPVGLLTAAAERMQRGDLDVQVDVRGGDEIAELAHAFNAMAARLAETERLRRQMVSDIAHELRSPVTNLRCNLEAMQDGLAPADRGGIDALHDETMFLQRLIADLQDLALAEAGRLDLRVRPVVLEDVIRRAVAATATAGTCGVRLQVEETAPAAATGGVRFQAEETATDSPFIRVEIESRLPAIEADPDRLEQVFRNLLTNARRHTPPDGAIVVRAGVHGDAVRVSVTDTGSGIDPEHLPHVFDRFYRADRSRARATGGAGLGLAIVRQLVVAHGGSVAVASQGPGQGATFTVTLPRSS